LPLLRSSRIEHVSVSLTTWYLARSKPTRKSKPRIPLRLSDEIPAEKISLVVITQLDAITVEALPKDLPDEIVVDASSLAEVGDKVTGRGYQTAGRCGAS